MKILFYHKFIVTFPFEHPLNSVGALAKFKKFDFMLDSKFVKCKSGSKFHGWLKVIKRFPSPS